MNWSIVMNVLFVVLIIAAIVLGVLYYFGRKLEKRQVEAQATIDAAKQVVTLMAIDKKKLKLKEAGLPARSKASAAGSRLCRRRRNS